MTGEQKRPAGYVGFEQDFARWSEQQAAYLRAKDWAAVDVEHVSDALAALSRGEQREIKQRLTALLENLLRIEAEPQHIERHSWEAIVEDQTREMHDLLDESPSLREALNAHLETAFARAVKRVAAATGEDSKMPRVMPMQRWRERVDELIADA